MNEINEILEEEWNEKLQPMQLKLDGQGHEIEYINKWVDVTENRIDNIQMFKQNDPGWSKKDDEKLKKLEEKVKEWKIEAIIFKDETTKELWDLKDAVFPKANV